MVPFCSEKSKAYIPGQMDTQCSFCCEDFNLDNYRPKTLQCGHTFCKECVQKLDLHQNCLSCGKVLLSEPVDNLFLIQLIEKNRCKVQVREEQVRQLARGIAAGEKLVAQLVKAVPAAVQALQQLLDSAASQVSELKQALEELRSVRREESGAGAAPELVPEQLEQAVRLVDGLRLMSISKSSLVAVEEDGTVWKAFDELGPAGRLLLLQLRVDGRLEKVRQGLLAEAGAGLALCAWFLLRSDSLQADGGAEAGGVPRQDDDDATASRSVVQTKGGAEHFCGGAALDSSTPLQDGASSPQAVLDSKTTVQDGDQSGEEVEGDGLDSSDEDLQADDEPFVGPPGISVLTINEEWDCDGELLKVNDILKSERWLHARALRRLNGGGSERLLRVLAPQLEELEIEGVASPSVMEEVAKMSKLKRLICKCDRKVDIYPDLPLQLEELAIECPKENQLRCVDRMRGLRSVKVWNYQGTNVSFLPSPQHAGLVWLEVALHQQLFSTMLSLVHAHAHSLRVLRVFCGAHELHHEGFYFPHLGKDLAAMGLSALEQLVLFRPHGKCDQVDDCLVQLRSFRESLGTSVDVICVACPRPV
ncbi:E3 ubiquitin-protein ligase TRIM32 [Frankliniella fusca]|uniref:E3 ubiquitin-protein ligase TRIM32 n=1 Tax=Frankliniella fusca TaxID=407009 RepID=A0AAE1HFL3_9NEOP|nr:E3 ubiquitin-protein ligase TRIM32 [Frankliniella fusca]